MIIGEGVTVNIYDYARPIDAPPPFTPPPQSPPSSPPLTPPPQSPPPSPETPPPSAPFPGSPPAMPPPPDTPLPATPPPDTPLPATPPPSSPSAPPSPPVPDSCLWVGTQVWCFNSVGNANSYAAYRLCGYSSAPAASTYTPATSAVRDALSAAAWPATYFGCDATFSDSAALGSRLTFTYLDQAHQYNHIQCRASGQVDMYGGPGGTNGWNTNGPDNFVRCANYE